MPEIDLGLEVAVLIDDSGMVVVTTTIVQLVLGLIGYIYIYSTPPKIYHFCLFHGCGCSSINLLKGEYHVYVYTHVLLCANC